MKKFRFSIISAIAVVIAVCIFSFGDPQWGKSIYMWQVYTMGKEDEKKDSLDLFLDDAPGVMVHSQVATLYYGPLLIPNDYSGTWRHWRENGSLASTTVFFGGIGKGKTEFFQSNVMTVRMLFNGTEALTYNYNTVGELMSIMLRSKNNGLIEIFSTSEKIDLRKKYKTQIESFEKMATSKPTT